MIPITDIIKNGSLIIWILLSGIIAGFFYTYSINVSVAFSKLNKENYALVESLCNVTVRNTKFYIIFFGTPLVGLIVTLLHYKGFNHLYFWLMLASVVTYVIGIILFTKNSILPLNYYTESWSLNAIPNDWEETRNKWNRYNDIRSIISIFCFLTVLVATFIKFKTNK